MRQVVKTYHTAAGPFTALKDVDLRASLGSLSTNFAPLKAWAAQASMQSLPDRQRSANLI